MRFLILIGTLLTSFGATAALQPLKAEFKKSNRYIVSGIITGGEAKKDLVISDLRHTFSAKASLERIVIEMGNTAGIVERVGYYHVAFDPRQNRIVVDMPGVSAAKQSLDEITKKLESSPFIKTAVITLDPEDRSATLEIDLKKSTRPYQVESFELVKPKEAGRMVLDITRKPSVH